MCVEDVDPQVNPTSSLWQSVRGLGGVALLGRKANTLFATV